MCIRDRLLSLLYLEFLLFTAFKIYQNLGSCTSQNDLFEKENLETISIPSVLSKKYIIVMALNTIGQKLCTLYTMRFCRKPIFNFRNNIYLFPMMVNVQKILYLIVPLVLKNFLFLQLVVVAVVVVVIVVVCLISFLEHDLINKRKKSMRAQFAQLQSFYVVSKGNYKLL